MPIYEYQCSDCRHAFDVLQKMHEDAVKKCPNCFKDSAVRLVSAPGFQLKGTGWYATDFKDKGKAPKQSDQKDTGSSTKGSASSEKKTEKASTTAVKGESS